jgi:hypothetical protein
MSECDFISIGWCWIRNLWTEMRNGKWRSMRRWEIKSKLWERLRRVRWKRNFKESRKKWGGIWSVMLRNRLLITGRDNCKSKRDNSYNKSKNRSKVHSFFMNSEINKNLRKSVWCVNLFLKTLIILVACV